MAQTYNVNGRSISFPEGTSQEQVSAALKKMNEDGAFNKYRQFAEVPQEIEADKLKDNADWMNASSRLFSVINRKPFSGSPEELADWSRSFMADFNYNIVSTGSTAHSLLNANQQDKEAFLFMMDTFDNTNMSWQGFGNAVKAVATDPTTYSGIATLGAGLVGKQALKIAGKEGLKLALKQSLGRTGLVAGTEAAVYSYADDRIRQNIEVDAGRKQERDTTQSLVATTTGFAFGAGLGVGLDLLANNVGKLFSKKAKGATSEATSEVNKAVEPNPTTTVDDAISTTPDTPEVAPVVEPPKLDDGVIKVNGIELPVYAQTLARRNPTLEESIQFAEGVASQMKRMDLADSEGLAKALGIERLTLREIEEVSIASQRARNELTDELDRAIQRNLQNPSVANQVNVMHLAELQEAVEGVDKVYRNTAGWMLRARQDQNTLYNDLTLSNVRRELQEAKGPDVPEQLVQLEFTNRKLEASNSYESQKVARQYDDQTRDLLKRGDLKGAMDKALEKNTALNKLDDLVQEEEAGLSAKLVEGSIANVFSVTTLQVNAFASTLKTLTMPAVRALLSDPLKLETRKQMTAAYGAMKSTMGGAWRASVASYRLEQTLLTRDPNKYLENALAIKGKFGGVLRTFIRMTTAQDEFLTQINYSSFIAGQAAHDAAISAQKKGLTGERLDKYINKEVKKALDNAYKQVDAEQALIPIVTKAKNLGLSGKAMEDYIRKEIARDPLALRVANTKDNELTQQAADYLRDVLYKREFSGEGVASGAGKWFEEGMNKFPTLKLITGQLFIRTPIRVFEEAVRITPAAQFLAPRFLSDIAGKNGVERQLRARAESMASIAMLGAIMTLYSEGAIQGAGSGTDWRQTALQRDSHMPDPYTITMDDGSTWSYRFFDPISTPMKAVVTALEHIDRLTIRKAQGEDVPEQAFDNAVTYIKLSGVAMMKAFKDANLLAGFSGFADAIDSSLNPEDRTSGWVRYVGEKMRLAVPSTIRKESLPFDNTMSDPATILQMAQAQLLDPFTKIMGVDQLETTAKAYDHMGRPKEVTDLGILRNIFSTASIEERQKGRSKEELFIDEKLLEMQGITDVIFRVPNKNAETGNVDYRTLKTKEGDKTLYDRWNELYYESLNKKALAKILAAPLPNGTMQHKGLRVQEVQSFLNTARDIAHTKLLVEQRQVFDMKTRTGITKEFSVNGLYDVDRKKNPPSLDQLLGQ